ncbi:hypothetical protein BT96DRAFT_1001680 [Gymnopus androsaceus JB14]|uniref:Uncharacterized protein n=1 Tax=Gymnopus androsaceus JB14 TaxID=1447944 RepID=A0A6A4H002_9AGAR|nr:hypothetical protein BT96DRAFT_1001680 [Gymnopus androsaceus JB14]
MSMARFNNQVWSDSPSTFFLPWSRETSPANTAIYLCNCCSAFDLRIFEDPAVAILSIHSDPEASPFIIKGQVIPPSSTYPACLAEWFPTHPQADFTFADGWHLHAHCFFLAHALHCFEAWVGTNEACDLPIALADFMVHLEPSLGVQVRILELGVTTAMPTPIPFDPSTAEGCHLALSLPPQDLEVFPPALLAPRNIISLVSAPPPPKVDSPAKPAAATSVSTATRVRMPPKATASVGTLPVSPKVTRSALHFEARLHKVAPKQPLVLLKSTRCVATSKLTRSASNSSSNGESEEEEDELEPSPPKHSTVSRKRHRSPSMASSNSLEVSSPESEAPIAKNIPATCSTVAKANLTSNPKGKQKACACSTSPEISAPVKGRPVKRPRTKVTVKEEVKPAAKVKKNGKKANHFTNSLLFPPRDDLEDFPSLQVNSKGLNNTLPQNLQVPFFNIGPRLSDLGVVLTHDHVGYTLEELQLVNRPLDLLGLSSSPAFLAKSVISNVLQIRKGLVASVPLVLWGLDCMYRHLDQCPAAFQDVLSEAQRLRVIHSHAVDISHHHQELIRQIEYDFLATMACLQSARSDTAIVLHQLVQSAPEHVRLSLDNLSFLATAFGWNSIFNLPDLLASLEVRNQLLNVGKEDEPDGSPVDSSSGEPSGLGSAQVPDAVASGAEANTQPDASASLIVQDDVSGQVARPLSAVPDS